jgi:hypothetical protein
LKIPIRIAVCALMTLPLATLGAGQPHQHGVARLDIAADPGRLTVLLDTPLDNLVGFERAPRTDAERQRAGEAVDRLKDGTSLFRIDPAAACTLASVELVSAALKLGAAAPTASTAKGDHADLEATWSFNCTGTPAAFVEVGLFDSFERLQTLDVQAATAKGQAKRRLKRPARRIELRR